MTGRGLEELLRELAPQVLGVLVRRYGRFDACEDATQEAMLQAVAHGDARADLRCTEAVQGEGAVHLRYEVR